MVTKNGEEASSICCEGGTQALRASGEADAMVAKALNPMDAYRREQKKKVRI